MLPGVIKTARSIDLRCHSIRDRFPCAFQKASANLMKDVRHHGYCSLFISLLASSMSTRGTNDGLSVIHYARRMIDADIDVSFSTSWFEHNQHMSALSDVMTLPENNEGSGKDPFETLREELVFLFDHLADKYNTVRDEDFEPLCTNIRRLHGSWLKDILYVRDKAFPATEVVGRELHCPAHRVPLHQGYEFVM